MPWIKVEDSLPMQFEDVLVWAENISGESYQIGELYMAIDRLVKWSEDNKISFRTDKWYGKVKYWMPLPSQPKD
jgi:hypothetical protein